VIQPSGTNSNGEFAKRIRLGKRFDPVRGFHSGPQRYTIGGNRTVMSSQGRLPSDEKYMKSIDQVLVVLRLPGTKLSMKDIHPNNSFTG
jgi:hypothetical protein